MKILKYDIIVVGGGHAGIEAALSAAKMKNSVLLCTLNIKKIANMPCNTSIGGSAKGIVVREIDALGGHMGKAADSTYLQMKVLNTSKGAGVQCLRAQCDKEKYLLYMQNLCLSTDNLTVRECEIKEILYKNKKIFGIKDNNNKIIYCKALILSTGTYMNACIHQGSDKKNSGPDGEKSSNGLSDFLKSMGINVIRLKTGTPPRIAKESIDFTKAKIMPGTRGKYAFSYTTNKFVSYKNQVPCYLMFTNEKTHEIIKRNIKKSARYSGKIKSVGPRYCPSIEEKIINFSDKTQHHIFLEQEYKDRNSIYLQGFSTSMPCDIQEQMVHSIVGLEKAIFLKYAYAIEYDSIDPLELDLTLRVKKYENLYIAGQICGTSGYEEAAALGLIAGINASQLIKKQDPFILRRDEAYIGVMIDDIVTKGITEPYRLLSSRAEYRLSLRHDNADLRLTEKAYKLGLIDKQRYRKFKIKEKQEKKVIAILNKLTFKKKEINLFLPKLKQYLSNDNGRIFASDLIKNGSSIDFLKKRIKIKELKNIKLSNIAKNQIENAIRFAGYIKIQKAEIQKFQKKENLLIPKNINYFDLNNIAFEARQKLDRIKPVSIGQASRISGVNYSDILGLIIDIKKYNQEKNSRKKQ
ncbi:MAG: tRNA uridine-5-carboxymethylaminomethyl(34) synthesis enzyme MnmG [Bacilli bacterium]|nr:tRNA uridine-5-carboxymethylaminomethyl(34) synthesis enzyme MnmG [Bacilli bacterium]